MTMHKISLLLLGLACAGHGRRLQSSVAQEDAVDEDKIDPLAKLLLTREPEAAFAGSASGLPDPKAVRSAGADMKVKMSRALPFLEAPACQDCGLVGDAGFDPLYFSNYFDLYYMREAELKHGRICMLASFGYIFQELYSIPAYPGYSPNPVEALSTVPPEGLLQILAFLAYVEIKSNEAGWPREGRGPGDLGFDPLEFGANPETREFLELAELKNGRLAMLAFSGMIHQTFVTGKPVLASLADIFADPK